MRMRMFGVAVTACVVWLGLTQQACGTVCSRDADCEATERCSSGTCRRRATTTPDAGPLFPDGTTGGGGTSGLIPPVSANCTPVGTPVAPAAIRVTAGEISNLQAQGVEPTATITWSIDAQPPEAGSSALWNPAPPVGAQVTFRAFILGEYTLRATVQDADGGTTSCLIVLDAVGRGLRIESRWDGPGDVDLHLHNATARGWFDNGTASSPAADCYFANCVGSGPLWTNDPARTGGNPRLDVDNTTANGPENINIDTPPDGSVYTIGIHNFSGADGRVVTVKVFCGASVSASPVRVSTSNPLTSDVVWKVGRVTMLPGGMCNFVTLNQYVAESVARGSL